ncbi:hypothetical protein CPSG_04723 [Coccidioides posadasii str. Silveira]|uniref:Uncharacterized protein n=1 Tax=Coccidioides posadasii (strain RMSCC 757 / Silveira) TaxID=443226 RepID=E9D3I2_COCPS|nr:hypothetical protein CPSG_04723 [Coccidioides posadasii str. Silveira]
MDEPRDLPAALGIEMRHNLGKGRQGGSEPKEDGDELLHTKVWRQRGEWRETIAEFLRGMSLFQDPCL